MLANVLVACGYDVTREYYINDAGVQVYKLLQSVRKSAGKAADKIVEYSGGYIADLASKAKSLDRDDREASQELVEIVINDLIKPAVKKMGIKFDVWTKESSVASDKAVAEALSRLESKNLIKKDKGGTIWLITPEDARKERVLIKADGTRSYLLNDIAYHLDVFKNRKFNKAIKIWGADHAGQVNSLAYAVKKLVEKDALDYVVMQIVRLLKQGKEVKVSKRAGNIITIDDLLAEVESDVARFFFLMRSSDTHMDFDLDLAKEESQKNPYWYIMYAYTRAQSIKKQAAKLKLTTATSISTLKPIERSMIRHLSKLPSLVQTIGTEAFYEVHKLTFYGMELAKIFHDFYEQDRIIKLPQGQAAEKLYLIDKFITAMKVYWQLLGIAPKDRM